MLMWLRALFKRPARDAKRLIVYAYVCEDGEVVRTEDYGSVSRQGALLARPDRGRYVIARDPGELDRWIVWDTYVTTPYKIYRDKDAALVATVMRATGREG